MARGVVIAAAVGFVAHWSTHFIATWGAVQWSMQDYGVRFNTELAGRHESDIGFVPCGWTLYKDPDKIPDESFKRIGRRRPSAFSRALRRTLVRVLLAVG